MTNLLDLDLIREIGNQLQTDPAFIKKEWYAIQLLTRMNTLPMEDGVKIVFMGGTCLANAPADKQVGFEDARANLAGLVESILDEG